MKNIIIKATIEVAGFPEEHVTNTVSKVIESIKTRENVVLKEQETFPVEKKEEMFATFAEVTVEFKEIVDIYAFCFDLMPSSIDILSPEDGLNIDSESFNSSINDLLATLHQQDMFLKNSNAKIKVMSNNMSNILRNFVSYLTHEKVEPKKMAKFIGIGEEHLTKLLENINQK